MPKPKFVNCRVCDKIYPIRSNYTFRKHFGGLRDNSDVFKLTELIGVLNLLEVHPEIVIKAGRDKHFIDYKLDTYRAYRYYEEQAAHILNNLFFCGVEHFDEWCKQRFHRVRPTIECCYCGQIGYLGNIVSSLNRWGTWNKYKTTSNNIERIYLYLNTDICRARNFCYKKGEFGSCNHKALRELFQIEWHKCLMCERLLLSGNYDNFKHMCQDVRRCFNMYRVDTLYGCTGKKVISCRGVNVSKQLCRNGCVAKFVKLDRKKAIEKVNKIYDVLEECLRPKGCGKIVIQTILSYASVLAANVY